MPAPQQTPEKHGLFPVQLHILDNESQEDAGDERHHEIRDAQTGASGFRATPGQARFVNQLDGWRVLEFIDAGLLELRIEKLVYLLLHLEFQHQLAILVL